MMDRSKYPDNWEEISKEIRQRRSGGRCECLGECGHDHEAENLEYVEYFIGEIPDDRCIAMNHEPHPITESWVVLTVAHLDHDTTNNDYGNLKAMCQRCHLAYDKDYHIANAARTRRQKLIDAGQLEMPL